jgi:hypothetical protein
MGVEARLKRPATLSGPFTQSHKLSAPSLGLPTLLSHVASGVHP